MLFALNTPSIHTFVIDISVFQSVEFIWSGLELGKRSISSTLLHEIVKEDTRRNSNSTAKLLKPDRF